MKVIKDKEVYRITLSDKEVDNIISVNGFTPVIGCLSEIQYYLKLARECGVCNKWLLNWNCVSARPLELKNND